MNDDFRNNDKDPWDQTGEPSEQEPPVANEPAASDSENSESSASEAPSSPVEPFSQVPSQDSENPESSAPEESSSSAESSSQDSENSESSASGAPSSPADGANDRTPPYQNPWGANPYSNYGARNPYGNQGNYSPYGRDNSHGYGYGGYNYDPYGQPRSGGRTANDPQPGGRAANDPQNQQNENQQNGQPNGGWGGNPYGDPYHYGNQYYQNGPYSPYGYGQGPNGQGQMPYGYGPNGQPPRRMGTGLKVFFWFLGVIVVGLAAAFIIFNVAGPGQYAPGPSASSGTPGYYTSSVPQLPGGTSSSAGSVISGVPGNGTNPNASGIVISAKPSGAQMSAADVYKKVIQSVVGVEVSIAGTNGQSGTSEGTGIIATSDGYILTNAHVVNDSRANPVKVVTHDNKTYAATVVGFDQTSDLAVLKINATGLSPAEFGSVDDMQVGDSVIAIGNPGGLSFAGSLTGGLISALNRSIENASDNGMTYIQTDAAINPGNSGGPLVNMYGQVIGINSNKIVATGYEGMGFAIPVSHATSIIDDLITNGYVAGRVRLGITAQTVDQMSGQFYGLPAGVLIASVGSDSDMKNQNVVKGDVITVADGMKLSSLDDLYTVLAKHKPGDVISMTVVSTSLSEEAGGQKAGTTRNIKVKLLEDKGQTQQAG